MQVGWLGLGAMGAPMAARAARAGHVVRGHDLGLGRRDDSVLIEVLRREHAPAREGPSPAA